MKNRFGLLLSFLLTACASYHNEHTAIMKDGSRIDKLKVSSAADEKLSSEYFQLLNFTFANDQDDWIRIKRVIISNQTISEDINLVVGDDLVSWANSAKAKLEVDEYNKQMWLGGVTAALMVAGAAAGAKAGNPIYLAPAFGALGVMVANDYFSKVSELERSKLLPPDHLYSPFSVAPGLFTKKWILLQGKGKPFPCELPIEVEFVDGKKTNFTARARYSHCEVR
ncbi:MAG: hypothetical protein ACOYL6_17665 [Bacteriovoracaceae bacterium]